MGPNGYVSAFVMYGYVFLRIYIKYIFGEIYIKIYSKGRYTPIWVEQEIKLYSTYIHITHI